MDTMTFWRILTGILTLLCLRILWGGAQDRTDAACGRFFAGIVISWHAFWLGWFTVMGHLPR